MIKIKESLGFRIYWKLWKFWPLDLLSEDCINDKLELVQNLKQIVHLSLFVFK